MDNFYHSQHMDGFICREINWTTGQERYHRFDPVSTGPNVLAWSEWNHYTIVEDKIRLAKVFPALVGYHNWTRFYRTWPDRSYWNSGWGCGMDNQQRMQPWPEGNLCFHHGFLSWIDSTAQALISARILEKIAVILDRKDVALSMRRESDQLSSLLHANFWNEKLGMYVDRFRDGSLSDYPGIGGFWMLLDDTLPQDRLAKLCEILDDTQYFNRPHRVPSLSASHAEYDRTGGYWKGAVWPPTNLMIIRGLHLQGKDDLAYAIARNHLDNVVAVHSQTNTVWENYAPETASPGHPAKGEFTGWSGIAPVTLLFESVFGLRPDVPAKKLIWDLRLLEEHGVKQYPFGVNDTLNLKVFARSTPTEVPVIEVSSSVSLTLELRWDGKVRTVVVDKST